MKNLKKKAFTLVELLVVIAIIAILAVAGVVGYVVFTKKAQQSNDTSLVSQLNEYMAAVSSTDNINTVTDARDLLIEDGIDLASLKLTAKGYRVAFDIANKKFIKVKDNSPEDYSGNAEDLFVFVANASDVETFTNAGYSVYLQNGFNSTTLSVKSGADVGENGGITAVNYTSSDSKAVVIRGAGDQCVLTVDAPNGDVDFYGFAKKIDVKDVKLTSLHIYGATNQLQVEKGHVAVEDTGIVFDVIQVGTTDAGTGASITNNGYIAASTLSEHTESAKTAAAAAVTGEAVGGDYKISSLAQFEAFRDAVNAGNNFAGLTVKLTKDIALNDGWKPIGEGYRDVADSNTEAYGITTFFAGTFDGQNHTISNLNNKGFIPTQARLVKDDNVNTYAWGLFALVENATFKDVKIIGVDFDETRYANANADSVGGLVGYSRGTLTVSGITVSGSLKGTDSVSGIVGRIRVGANAISITSCTNNSNISSKVAASGIARIYKQEAGYSVTLVGNTNTGTIVSTYKYDLSAGISIYNMNINLVQSNNTSNGATATITAGSSATGGNSYLG